MRSCIVKQQKQHGIKEEKKTCHGFEEDEYWTEIILAHSRLHSIHTENESRHMNQRCDSESKYSIMSGCPQEGGRTAVHLQANLFILHLLVWGRGGKLF